jgi:putative toxin-antitoxin system antitoxin component (TIGR02293 family)
MKTERQPLNTAKSNRLAHIETLAQEVLGNPKKAHRWLREGLGILGGKSPLEVAQTEAGARVVEQILAKIDWEGAA